MQSVSALSSFVELRIFLSLLCFVCDNSTALSGYCNVLFNFFGHFACHEITQNCVNGHQFLFNFVAVSLFCI